MGEVVGEGVGMPVYRRRSFFRRGAASVGRFRGRSRRFGKRTGSSVYRRKRAFGFARRYTTPRFFFPPMSAMKFKDTALSGNVTVPSAGAAKALHSIDLGTELYQRVGRAVDLVSLWVDMTLTPVAASEASKDELIRCLVVMSNQPLTKETDIIATHGAVIDPTKMRVLYDRVTTLRGEGLGDVDGTHYFDQGHYRHFRWGCRLPARVSYDSGGTIVGPYVYMLIVGVQATAAYTVSGNYRVKFMDVRQS